MPEMIPGFRGTVIGPDDDGYDTHREVWNAVVDQTPGAHRAVHQRGRRRRGNRLRAAARPRDRREVRRALGARAIGAP